MKKVCKQKYKDKTCTKADYAKIPDENGINGTAGDGMSKGCIFINQDKRCIRICKGFHRETCEANRCPLPVEPPETCNFGGGAQTNYCKAGTTGTVSADDLGSWSSKKDKFCNAGAANGARCQVSCGTCPVVESCNEPLTTYPGCAAGVAPTASFTAQEKRDEFCTFAVLAGCPVSCGMCIVESCDDLSTRNPECRLGVTANEAYDAQAKKDKYCKYLPSQTKCPVSCRGATIEGPTPVCKTPPPPPPAL